MRPPRGSDHVAGLFGGLRARVHRYAHVCLRERGRIGQTPPAEFETLVGTLPAKLGFEDVTVTSVSNDGGIDVRGTMVTGDVIRTRMAVQVNSGD